MDKYGYLGRLAGSKYSTLNISGLKGAIPLDLKPPVMLSGLTDLEISYINMTFPGFALRRLHNPSCGEKTSENKFIISDSILTLSVVDGSSGRFCKNSSLSVVCTRVIALAIWVGKFFILPIAILEVVTEDSGLG